MPVTLHLIVICKGGLLPGRLVGRRVCHPAPLSSLWGSMGTSLVPTRTLSHGHVLRRGLSWCVLAPPNGYTFFCAYVPGLSPLPVTGGGLFSLLIFSAKIYPSHLEFSHSGVTFPSHGANRELICFWPANTCCLE